MKKFLSLLLSPFLLLSSFSPSSLSSCFCFSSLKKKKKKVYKNELYYNSLRLRTHTKESTTRREINQTRLGVQQDNPASSHPDREIDYSHPECSGGVHRGVQKLRVQGFRVQSSELRSAEFGV